MSTCEQVLRSSVPNRRCGFAKASLSKHENQLVLVRSRFLDYEGPQVTDIQPHFGDFLVSSFVGVSLTQILSRVRRLAIRTGTSAAAHRLNRPSPPPRDHQQEVLHRLPSRRIRGRTCSGRCSLLDEGSEFTAKSLRRDRLLFDDSNSSYLRLFTV